MSHKLQPLNRRLNRNQADKRQRKIEARRIVAAQLQGQMRTVGMYTYSFIHRGFFSRLKWLLFGESTPSQQGETNAQ